MQVTADLTGANVLITGAAVATRRTVRRYQAAGANVCTINCPAHFLTSVLDEVVLVVAVDDGDPGWTALKQACALHGVFLATEPAAKPGHTVTLIDSAAGTSDVLSGSSLAELNEADILYYDPFGLHFNFVQLAPAAKLINLAEKYGNRPLEPAEVRALMVASARRGNRVVRLQAAHRVDAQQRDAELAACVAAAIPVSVLPLPNWGSQPARLPKSVMGVAETRSLDYRSPS